MPGESEEDFRLLEQQFIQDFSPQDIAQSAMVRSLAVITWKKLRAEKIEHSGLLLALSTPFDLSDYHKLNLPFGKHNPQIVLDWLRRLSDEDIAEWVDAVRIVRRFLETDATVTELQALQKQSPLLYQYYEDEADGIGATGRGPTYWATAKVKTYDDVVHDFIKRYSDMFIKSHEVEVWAIDHIDEFKQGVKDMKEARLLRFIQQKNIQRVHDDLDRAFYRTLNELRNHQRWRRDESAIEVTDAEA